MTRRRRHLVIMALVGATSACSAIIGVKDLTPGPPNEADGSSMSDASLAPRDAGAACEADASLDPHPCGSCGLPCADVACDAGRCPPVLLTSSEINLEELSLAGDRVLYRAHGSIRSVGLNGGLPSVLVPCSDHRGLAVTSRGVYSFCGTSLNLRGIVDGELRSSSTTGGFNLAATNDWVFFCQFTSELDRVVATLNQAAIDRISDSAEIRSLATNTTELFYMTLGGSLFHVPLGSGSGTELEREQTAPTEIAVDDTAVFWGTSSDSGDAILHSRTFSPNAATTLATKLDHPNGIAIDQRYVYVTLRGTPPSYANGAIVRVPRAGGAVETLAEGLLLPHRIVVTDSLVIWTSLGTSSGGDYTGGAIYRLAK